MYHKLAYLLLFGSRLLRSIFKMVLNVSCLKAINQYGWLSGPQWERHLATIKLKTLSHSYESYGPYVMGEYSLNQRWSSQVMSQHQLAIYDNWYHIKRLYYKRSLGPWRSWTRVSTQLWPPPNSLYPNRMNHLPLRYSWYLPRLPKLIWNKIKISA